MFNILFIAKVIKLSQEYKWNIKEKLNEKEKPQFRVELFLVQKYPSYSATL